MTAYPLTSIVIPARDAEKTIAETLDSLLAQSVSNWEALVVDDGSVDATSAIVAEYAARDPRFIALKSNGDGASGARNKGISNASGERMLFLDGDDWIDRSFLAKMNAALDSDPSAVAAYCNNCWVTPDRSETPVRSDPSIQENAFERFARACATVIHGVLIRMNAVVKVGTFDINLRTCEDWDFWQRVARCGGRWIHVNEKLSYYRMSGSSLTQDVERMLADAWVVIARGFSGDDRVKEPAPAHRAGASTVYGSASTAYAYFALWCAGFDCGRRNASNPSLETLVDIPKNEASADAITAVLLEAILVGARTTPAELAGRWPQYGEGVTSLIAAIGRAWNDPAAGRKCQYRFERKVLDYDDLSARRVLALTLGMRVDLRRIRTIRPIGSIDRLYVYLCDGPRVLALLDIGVIGAVDSSFWMTLVADGVTHLRIKDQVGRLVRSKIELHGRTRWLRRFVREGRDTHRSRLHELHVLASCQARPFAISSIPAASDRKRCNGAVARRSDLARSERRTHVPVLMYHRIANDGPIDLARYRLSPDAFREQMLWLRRNGYHAINSDQLAWFVANGHSFVGRPVLITFNDGYEDFAQHAWPVLQANDFSAEVFIATDFVGKRAAWDASFGDPAPLLDEARIAGLAAEGVSFGSHLASHPRGEELATWKLAEELMRSRAQLEKWLGRSITSLAAPLGNTDQRLGILAAECGYRTVFNTVGRAATLKDNLFDLPRIEVRGDFAQDSFVHCLEQYQ
jgi:glycosyltransferase involved in cell wall biosynthesis/peptidoglycan/xylan/chitin deacetylase (PgdA/CDA1 family)